jgi:hypothetical protein
MSATIASGDKVSAVVSGGGVVSPVVPKTRKARSKNGAPSRPKPLKALLSIREISHYNRLKTALKQGSRIKAPILLADFCKPLLSIDETEGGDDAVLADEPTAQDPK